MYTTISSTLNVMTLDIYTFLLQQSHGTSHISEIVPSSPAMEQRQGRPPTPPGVKQQTIVPVSTRPNVEKASARVAEPYDSLV